MFNISKSYMFNNDYIDICKIHTWKDSKYMYSAILKKLKYPL